MKVIIPMAGMGKRMRPHTLNTPKPLLKMAGMSIVERIIRELKKSTGRKIDEIHFIIGNFGKEIENTIINIAYSIGSKGFIHYQYEPLGTAHAVLCAEMALKEDIIIAFADTMFIGDFTINDIDEAIIWTKEVKNPERYGVIKINKDKKVTGFIEKPKNFISDKAIIGIYYFRKGEILAKALRELINEKRMKSNEYQLTDALMELLENGMKFKCAVIDEWLDCGNKDEFLESTFRIMKGIRKTISNDKDVNLVQPVYIGKNVLVKNSTIGPNVAIEDDTEIIDSSIKTSVVGSKTKIFDSKIENSIIGNNSELKGVNGVLNIGDYNKYENY